MEFTEVTCNVYVNRKSYVKLSFLRKTTAAEGMSMTIFFFSENLACDSDTGLRK